MFSSVRRSFLVACGAVLCAQPVASHADTTLRLYYGPATPCSFTTNADGVTLDPATGDLVATGTFGSGCQTAPPTDPSFTDPLAGDIPASVTVGSSLTLTWAANASQCTYTGSSLPPGSTAAWPTTGNACTSTSTCAAAHSTTVTADVAGTYNFNLTCSNAGNPTTVSSSATTTASVSGGQCTTGPAGLTQQTTGDVTYYSPGLSAHGVDLTQYQNFLGRVTPMGPILPWPNLNGVLAYTIMDRNKYLSMKFTVPLVTLQANGQIRRGDINYPREDVDGTSASISETCGDFSVPSPCSINHGVRANALLQWTIDGNPNEITGACALVPGHTYYLNIMMSPIGNPANSYCEGPNCLMSIVGQESH